MNIQARKLNIIEAFLRINDENIILKIEKILNTEKTKLNEKEFQQMPLNQFYEMIDKSLEDSKAGKVISNNELKEKIKTWK